MKMIYQKSIIPESWEKHREKKLNNLLNNPNYKHKVWKIEDGKLYKICPLCKKWYLYDIKFFHKKWVYIDAKRSNSEMRLNSRCRKCKNKYETKTQSTSKHFKFYMYTRGASHRTIPFELSEKQCEKLFTQPCYYCGYISKTLNGIDRVHSEKGYTKDNSVSCCKACNMMKGRLETKRGKKWNIDYIEHCTKVANYKSIISS